ncbi:MAG: phosphatase PAP2-related protein [Candidatus Doudnabacteria bacterium]
MRSLIDAHRKTWNREFSRSVTWGVIFFLASLVPNYLATTYATERASMPVTDLILSNIRVYDVDGIIIYGAVLLIIFSILVLFYDPKRIPFTLKALALFIVIRSIFVSLTHLGPFSPQDVIDSTHIFNFLGFGTTADLFFSGHTGIPFLLALIYWNNIKLRWTYLAISAVFAVSVLLGHLHYSIDVLAAFFITYTIFHIAQKLFADDWQLSIT